MPQVVPSSSSASGSQTALTRRTALRLLGSQIALVAAGCSRPTEQIVPYVNMPENLVPGDVTRFATVLPLGGFGRGVTAFSVEGRPIKVEGLAAHPASLGSTDAYAEASVLSLYEPDRLRTVQRNGDITSWTAFQGALQAERDRTQSAQGEGLRLLTPRIASPTLARQMDDLLRALPKARWHAYDPMDDQAAEDGARAAFGRPVSSIAHLDRADCVLCLGADPLGPGPMQIHYGRGFAARRAPGRMSRVYVLESAPSLTGAKADERMAVRPEHLAEAAIALAKALGADVRGASLPDDVSAFMQAAAAELKRAKGRAVVLVGNGLPASAHALAHWMNQTLGAPVDLLDPHDLMGKQGPGSLADLAHDLRANLVRTLIVLDANPAYDAPADLRFAEAMSSAPFRICASLRDNETAAQCEWNLPLSHPLESWSDLRAFDGTASIMQPLIRPLYGTRTVHEILALVQGNDDRSSYDLVRETWKSEGGDRFETWWADALRKGVIEGSAAKPLSSSVKLPSVGPAQSPDDAFTLVLQPDPCVWDGCFADNAWLQELPKPISKQVWGNSLGLGFEDGRSLGLATGDVVRVKTSDAFVEATVRLDSSHARRVVSLTLGYGRTRAGRIGTGIGTNAYALRRSDCMWVLGGVQLEMTGKQDLVLTTENVVRKSSDVDDETLHKLYPIMTSSALESGGKLRLDKPRPSLYPERPRPPAEHAWGMVIDNSLCIGCNACVVACQAENNIPVVGPDEVRRGRQMHWIRIETYDHGEDDKARLGFQPVPCMHCEKAPCEPVCPVEASVHDGEGLNVQVYNRCIGTRFCEANCPYKVRRFNFFGYADGQEYADLGAETYKAQKNPEVTVRTRGVMEKCTYCVQRISAARRASERDDRPIGPHEVVTACAAACPTRAISFGDLDNDQSGIRALRDDPRHYALRDELGTRPRTTYLADLKNPDPDLGSKT